ncbi:hypothetical protein DY000_02048177 [Brassica cretica]|uniref:Uncharacterized protein n=1 Tax=Brassica cretica TaxID=69181 RepID=A0ABQ7EPP1_BRACR|nr:hypothetical protein DY000_02048177 [Brassica cretica]
MDNGVENLSRQQHNTLEHQHKVTKEFYNTTGGVDDRFKPKYRQHTRPLIDNDIPTSIHRQPKFGKRAYDRDGIRRFHWEQKDEYEVYRDDHGHARGVDGHIIHVSKDDIKNLLERAPMDEQSYISQEKNEDDFQMKLDGVYYPLKDNISWLTTCMEEMRQDIAIMQTHRAAKATTPASIDIYISPSIGDAPSQSNLTKYKPDSYTRAEREIVEIQRYSASHPEASTSINRGIQISINEATPTDRGQLVTKIVEDREYNCNNEGQMAQRRRGNERLHCTSPAATNDNILTSIDIYSSLIALKRQKWINLSTILHLLRMFEGTKADLQPN